MHRWRLMTQNREFRGAKNLLSRCWRRRSAGVFQQRLITNFDSTGRLYAYIFPPPSCHWDLNDKCSWCNNFFILRTFLSPKDIFRSVQRNTNSGFTLSESYHFATDRFLKLLRCCVFSCFVILHRLLQRNFFLRDVLKVKTWRMRKIMDYKW